MKNLKFKRVFQNFDTKAIEFREWGPTWENGKSTSFISPSYLHGFIAVADIQFTGLTDKNGKEIYEGEEAKCVEHQIRGIVEFHKGAFSLKITISNSATYDVGQSIALYNFSDLELTGKNIYETPELL